MKFFVDEAKGTVVCKMSEDCYFGDEAIPEHLIFSGAKSPREEAVDYLVKRASKRLCEDAKLPGNGLFSGLRYQVMEGIRLIAAAVVARHVKLEYTGKAHCSGVDMATGKFDIVTGTELAKSRCLMKYWDDVYQAADELWNIFYDFTESISDRCASSTENYIRREETVDMILTEVENNVD